MIKDLNKTKEFLKYLHSLPSSNFDENCIELINDNMNKIDEDYLSKNINSIISANKIYLI